MATIQELRCSICLRSYAPESVQYACPHCGLVGTLDVLYDYDALKTQLDRDSLRINREPSMWRYRDLLPISPETVVPPLQVGYTPLLDSRRLAENLGVRRAWVKDDGQNPTASLKDRASAMVVSRAIEKGISVVSAASTGNAAAALSGVGASVETAKIDIIIFVPATAPEAKIAQLRVYGAKVLLVEGTYDQAFDLCFEMSQQQGWYCRNTGINPFTIEGKKTVAYEIAEQMEWHVPEALIVSVGDGNILAGVHKGFWDLYQLGWIKRIPRLIGVQAEGSSALVKAWEQNLNAVDMQPQPADTIADSISAGVPRDRSKALRAVRKTSGGFLAVSDADIIASIPKLARLTGVFAEPAAAAVYAGAKRAVELNWIHPDDEIVLLVTGSGLKDVKRAQESVTGAIRVQPDLASVRQALNL